ncbi:MAG: BatA domain-containing protein [Planctomycetia bacterium]|nr:BatA domain-containing protein [Planctomycetia bacterium]
MALLWPFALVGLLALPVVAWLHRRLTRAVPVVVPSLRFLADEVDADRDARRRRVDLDLWLALAGCAAVACAAAGPVWRSHGAGRTVRVVVDDGPAMAARGLDGSTAAARAEAAVARLRARLAPEDVLARVAAAGDDVVAAARRGGAALRVVVSDRLPALATPGVEVVAVGDPAARNAGLVAAAATVAGTTRRVFVAVRNDAADARVLRVAVAGGGAAALDVAANGVASTTLDAPAGDGPIVVRLDDPDGALAADDEVRLVPSVLRVAVAGPDEGLPAAHGDLVRRTLDVVAPGWVAVAPAEAALSVGVAATVAPAGGAALWLHPVAPGATGVRAPAGAARERPPAPFGDDLDVASLDLVYARDVLASAPWPLLRVRTRPAGGTAVEVLFDPLAGAPPPADTAAWPILVENVVTAVAGAPTPGGFRVLGLAPPDRARLGRDRRDLDDAALAGAAPDRPPVERSLRAPLLALAAVSWAALWGRGGRRRVA